MKRFVCIYVLLSFILTSLGPIPKAQAQAVSDGSTSSPLALPKPGTMVNVSSAFEPVLIKGLKVDPKNPFAFNFIIDTGNTMYGRAGGSPLQAETSKLIKYFLAAMTIPEKDLWVNLSPYEKDRMIAPNLGQTEMGRDMLAQDYILKQLTASMIYPEKDLGKTFWNKVYAQAQAQFGTTNIPVNTFNKVWIVADRADVFEKGNTAYVIGAHLRVMLEEDYLALSKNGRGVLQYAPTKGANQIGSQIIREIVLPALEQEVNEGQNFAPLRQIFYSMILASWYKTALKDAILTQIYADQNKLAGVGNGRDRSLQDNNAIFERYLEAYKKGVFNYIKEDVVGDDRDRPSSIPRKYFSGGLAINVDGAMRVFRDQLPQGAKPFKTGEIFDAAVLTSPKAHDIDDRAMILSENIAKLIFEDPMVLVTGLTSKHLGGLLPTDKISLSSLIDRGNLLPYSVTIHGGLPDEVKQAYLNGEISVDEFLNQEKEFIRQRGGEKFLFSGKLLQDITSTLRSRVTSDEQLHKMAESMVFLFNDELVYTLGGAISLLMSSDVYFNAEEALRIEKITKRLEGINTRHGALRRFFVPKFLKTDRFTYDLQKMTRAEMVSLISEALINIQKTIEEVRMLQTADVSNLEAEFRNDPINKANALLMLLRYKQGLVTGLAHLQMVYDLYSALLSDEADFTSAADPAMPAKQSIETTEKVKQAITKLLGKPYLIDDGISVENVSKESGLSEAIVESILSDWVGHGFMTAVFWSDGEEPVDLDQQWIEGKLSPEEYIRQERLFNEEHNKEFKRYFLSSYMLFELLENSSITEHDLPKMGERLYHIIGSRLNFTTYQMRPLNYNPTGLSSTQIKQIENVHRLMKQMYRQKDYLQRELFPALSRSSDRSPDWNELRGLRGVTYLRSVIFRLRQMLDKADEISYWVNKPILERVLKHAEPDRKQDALNFIRAQQGVISGVMHMKMIIDAYTLALIKVEHDLDIASFQKPGQEPNAAMAAKKPGEKTNVKFYHSASGPLYIYARFDPETQYTYYSTSGIWHERTHSTAVSGFVACEMRTGDFTEDYDPWNVVLRLRQKQLKLISGRVDEAMSSRNGKVSDPAMAVKGGNIRQVQYLLEQKMWDGLVRVLNRIFKNASDLKDPKLMKFTDSVFRSIQSSPNYSGFIRSNAFETLPDFLKSRFDRAMNASTGGIDLTRSNGYNNEKEEPLNSQLLIAGKEFRKIPTGSLTMEARNVGSDSFIEEISVRGNRVVDVGVGGQGVFGTSAVTYRELKQILSAKGVHLNGIELLPENIPPDLSNEIVHADILNLDGEALNLVQKADTIRISNLVGYHFNESQQGILFKNLGTHMKPGACLIITHGHYGQEEGFVYVKKGEKLVLERFIYRVLEVGGKILSYTSNTRSPLSLFNNQSFEEELLLHGELELKNVNDAPIDVYVKALRAKHPTCDVKAVGLMASMDIGYVRNLVKGSNLSKFVDSFDPQDTAMLVAGSRSKAQKGGIDLTRANDQIHVRKEAQGVEMQFDPAMIEKIKRDGFDGLVFSILSITPLRDLPF